MAEDEPTDADEKEPRPPIVVPRTTRIAIGVAAVIIGLAVLIVAGGALKIIGVVVALGGVFDLVMGSRQARVP